MPSHYPPRRSRDLATDPDELAVWALIDRFAATVNDRAFDTVDEMFVAGATWEIDGAVVRKPPGAFLQSVVERHAELRLHVLKGTVEVHGPRAEAIWLITEVVTGTDGEVRQMGGCYTDELVLESDGWKFARHSYRECHADPELVLRRAQDPEGTVRG